MGGKHYTFPEVKAFFAERGFTLLSKRYTGSKQPLRYRCVCGRAERVRCFGHFKDENGIRCGLCGSEARSRASRAFMNDPKVLEARRRTWRKKYGTDSPMQNETVKARRRATCMKRYGVPNVSECPAISKRQHDGFCKKYGVNHFMQIPASLAKYRATMIDRYGAPSLAFVSRRSSKQAQWFFTELYAMLPKRYRSHCHFSPLTHEFNVWRNRKYFKYDFVHSRLKCCIEYNGTRFHPRPEQKDNETGWCLYHPKRTVREARAYEKRKLGALRARGFRIRVVWDTEAHRDRTKTLQRCLKFLLKPRRKPKSPA